MGLVNMEHRRRRRRRMKRERLPGENIVTLCNTLILLVFVVCQEMVQSFVTAPDVAGCAHRRRHFDSSGPEAAVSASVTSSMSSSSSSSIGKSTSSSRNSTDKKNQFLLSGEREQQILKLGKAGETDGALKMYWSLWSDDKHDRIRPRTRHMNMAIDACARAQPVARLDEALRIFEYSVQQGCLQPNQFTFASLIFVCARAGNYEKAKQILQDMPQRYNIEPNGVVYSTAMAACERSTPPQPLLALELLRESLSKGISVGVVGYNAIISAFARAGDASGAIILLHEMERGHVQTQEQNKNGTISFPTSTNTRNPLIPSPDHISYATVMAAYERSRQWQQVITYGEEAKRRGFRLDGIAYSSMLKSCQQLGLAREAISYIQEMKQLSSYSNSAYAPRTTRGREFRGAKEELLGPDSVAYGLAISACGNAGRWKDGIKLLEDMKEQVPINSKNTNNNGYVMAYTAAITGCAQAGYWREAFQLLNDMIESSHTPNAITYSAVISSCAEAIASSSSSSEVQDRLPPLEAALGLLEKIKQQQDDLTLPNIGIYNSLIRVCAEAQSPDKAFQLFEEATYRLKPDIFTFGCLMTACERAGNLDLAAKVLQLMNEYNITPNEIIYGAAISCCRKTGEDKKALFLFRKMLTAGLKPNASTFHTIMSTLVEQGEVDKALEILKVMGSSKYSLQPPKSKSYGIVIKGLSNLKRPDEALVLLEEMYDLNLRPEVQSYTAIVASYEKTGRPLKAIEVMEAMRENGYEFYGVEVLNSVFKRLIKLANKLGKGLSSGSDL